MKTFIMIVYCVTLLASVLMVVLLIKEKKRLTNPYMIICLVTITIMLWKIADTIGILD